MSGNILDLVSPDDGRSDDGGKRSQTDRLVDLALERYALGVTSTGETYGVPIAGPRVARMLRGSSQSLRAELSRAYFTLYRKAPSSTSLADALLTVQGFAATEQPSTLHIRQAISGDALWIDLGDTSGRAVRVDASGWKVVDSAPITFRRSELTGDLPIPQEGQIEELRGFLNVTDEAWRLIVGWLVSACFPTLQHPALILTGEQGSAKSSTGRKLISIVDPSPAPLRTAPRDVGEWVTTADGSYIVGLDNLSGLPAWLSDALCRAITGDGLPRRRLYSDGDLVVTAFRKTLLLTGIDLGALSADLIDRALFVELERIDPARRRLESELEDAFAEARPRIFGGLLDLVAGAMREFPNAKLDTLPRMADHALVLHALDTATGGEYLAAFEDAADRAILDASDGSPIVEALLIFMSGRQEWSGTATELYESVTPREAPKRWPATAHHLSGQLRRLAPVLRARGVAVTFERRGHERSRVIVLTRTADAADACFHFQSERRDGGTGVSDQSVCKTSVRSVRSVRTKTRQGEEATDGRAGDGRGTIVSTIWQRKERR